MKGFRGKQKRDESFTVIVRESKDFVFTSVVPTEEYRSKLLIKTFIMGSI